MSFHSCKESPQSLRPRGDWYEGLIVFLVGCAVGSVLLCVFEELGRGAHDALGVILVGVHDLGKGGVALGVVTVEVASEGDDLAVLHPAKQVLGLEHLGQRVAVDLTVQAHIKELFNRRAGVAVHVGQHGGNALLSDLVDGTVEVAAPILMGEGHFQQQDIGAVYIPSLGVDYTYENEAFEIVSSFEGVVVEKKNDALYGLSVVVENEDGLRAHYCGLSDVSVFEDEKVVQGQVIAKSGESVINANLGNHLHFAIEYNDTYLNPLKVYDKSIDEIIN